MVWTLQPPHLGLGKGQAGMGPELALTMNKNCVPCTERCRRFPAWRGGCGAEKGGGGSLQGRWWVALDGLRPVVAVQCWHPSGESWWLFKPGAFITFTRHMACPHHRGIRATEDEQDVLPCLVTEELIHASGGRVPALPLVPCLLPCPSLVTMPSPSLRSRVPPKHVPGSQGC